MKRLGVSVGRLPQLLHLAFFLSGLAALLFESLWFYQAGLGLGNSVWASSLVLAAFMGGLAIGNGLVGHFGHRIRYPVRFYALLELVIAGSGFGLVCLLPVITPALVPLFRHVLDSTLELNTLRLAVSFGLLLIPASAMGATMPLLVSALYRRDRRFGAVLGRLYGWNTLGAVVGAVAGDAFLVGWFGVYGAAATAATVNCCAAGLAFALARGPGGEALQAAPPADSDRGEPSVLSARAGSVLLAAFLSGATLLALEVVWYRFLLLWVAGTSTAFAVMLAVVLAGIGLGGLVASRWLASRPDAHGYLPAIAALSGALCTAIYAGFGFVPHWAGIEKAYVFSDILSLSLPLMFPVSFASGVIFTFLGEALNRESPGETRSAGFLTLANTLGAMIGSMAAGFILLPTIGIERSILVLSLSYGLVAIAAIPGGMRRPDRAPKGALVVGGAMLVFSAAFFPHGLMLRSFAVTPLQTYIRSSTQARESQLVEIREGLTETLMYLRHTAFGQPMAYRLVTNSHSMTSTQPRDARYMKLFVYWPVAVHPEPKDALLISYGVGVTAKALTDSAAIERIDVVDISKDVLEMSHLVYPDPADHPLRDPRVTVHIEDGRYYLQTTDRLYDIITGEPPPPKLAGVVTLYTREYFQLVLDRLAEGGIATYWLPTHSLGEKDAKAIVGAFCDVFEDCTLWGGSGFDFMLVGTRGAVGPVSVEHFSAQWQSRLVGPEIRSLGFEHPEQLAALFMGGREQLLDLVGNSASLTDAFPKRLSDAVNSEPEKFRLWNDAETSRRSFERDPTVARLVPRRIIDGALAYFDDQFEVQRAMMREVRPVDRIAVIHRWLTETDLVTAPLFLMGTNPRFDEAVRSAWKTGRRDPSIHYYLGVSALVNREYAAAADRFHRTPIENPLGLLSRGLEIYALAMAGKCEDARTRTREAGFAASPEPQIRRFNDLVSGLCASP